VQHRPDLIWWSVTGIGVATAALLWVYDKTVRASTVAVSEQNNA